MRRNGLRSHSDGAGASGVNRSASIIEPLLLDEHEGAALCGVSRIQALNAKAVDTLDALLDVTDAPSVRLGAAKTIVEIGIHQHDADTIMRKLDEIEQWQQRQELMKPNLSPF